MKTNFFKSSFLALAMMASFSACTQNEELGTPAPADEDILNVVAYSNNFVSTDAASRITDNDTTTTFTDGDAIGVFIVRDGEALVSNMKMTLSGTAWKGDNDDPLYYYKNADYIAYYPYTANLAVTTVDEIVEYFTSKISATGQTSLADYRNADLMTAEVKAADVVRGQNITFSFAHKMAMLEVKAPVRSYTTSTTYNGEAFTYKAPLGLKVVNGNQELSLCNVGTDTTSGKDIFRCILVPSATEMTIEGQFQDGNVEVYFPAVGQEVKYTPAAGTYQGINIAYTYDYGTTGSTRDLKVGDYYYSDGSIYPEELTGAPKDGCVGIIYSTTVPADVPVEYNHAMVLALHDLDSKINWSKKFGSVSLTKQYAVTTNVSDQTLMDLFADKNGYTYMTEIKSKDDFSAENYPAFYSVCKAQNGLADISSLKTSGWYIPTLGQMADIVNSFSTLASAGYEFGVNTAWNVGGNDGPTINAMLELYDRIIKVGGTWNIDRPASNGDTSKSLRWWTSSEHSADQALSIDMNCKKFVVLARGKESADADKLYIRPVFAF